MGSKWFRFGIVCQFETDRTCGRLDRHTRVLRRIAGAGPPPTRYDLIHVQRAEARRWPLHHGRVDLGDLDIERGEPMTDGCFVVELLDRGELLLPLAEQLERWRQHGDLLTLDKLLHPPERVICLIEIREGLTSPRQVVEGSRFRGDTNLRIDPRLPARPRRLALRHGGRPPRQAIAPRSRWLSGDGFRLRSAILRCPRNSVAYISDIGCVTDCCHTATSQIILPS